MSVKTKIRIGLLLRGPRRFGALSRAPFRRSGGSTGPRASCKDAARPLQGASRPSAVARGTWNVERI